MKLLLPCPSCLGRGRALNPPTPCRNCHGQCHIPTPIEDITPEQATLLRRHLAIIPPDPTTEYESQSTRENITTLLTKFYPRSVTFPADEPTEIHLTAASGLTLRIYPEFRSGKFHNLNVQPLPESPST